MVGASATMTGVDDGVGVAVISSTNPDSEVPRARTSDPIPPVAVA